MIAKSRISHILTVVLCAALILTPVNPVYAAEEPAAEGVVEAVEPAGESEQVEEVPVSQEVVPAEEVTPAAGNEETVSVPETSEADTEIPAAEPESAVVEETPVPTAVPTPETAQNEDAASILEEQMKSPEESEDPQAEELDAEETDEEKEDETEEEEEEDEEKPSGEEVALAIHEIVEATGQMESADEAGIEQLQTYIAETQEAFSELTEEEQQVLSESAGYLDSASSAVDTMQEAMVQVAETGTVVIEQTGSYNSWRYLDGELITQVLDTIAVETEIVAEVEPQIEEKSVADVESPGEEETVASEAASEIAPEPEAEMPVEEMEAATMATESSEIDPLPEDSVQEVVSDESAAELMSAADSGGSVKGELATIMLPVGIDPAQAQLVANTTPRRGIDVSRYQGDIDWASVKASGIEFAIIQCGYGNDLSYQDDSKWLRNVTECEKYGIPYGVYLYSYATNESMIDSEVQHTLRLLRGHKPALPVYLDMEQSEQSALGNATLSRLAIRYCSQIKAAGYQAGVYANLHWYNNFLSSFATDGNYYHWIAQWNSSCWYTGRYETWQYTVADAGTVSGISTRIDMDYWYGDFPSSAGIVTPTPTPTPTPAPAPDDGTWKKETVNGKTVKRYYAKSGSMVKGQKKIGYYWYMFDMSTGAMVTGWYNHTKITNPQGGPKTCYYDGNGHMLYNQQKIGGYWYMFHPSSGAMITGFYNHSFATNPQGGPKTCYYDSNGRMLYNQRKIGGYWYMFNQYSGAMVTGFYKHTQATNPQGGPKTCYYDGNGHMLYGQRKIGDCWYMFHPTSGAMMTGFYRHTWSTNPQGGPKTCYYDGNGRMVYGQRKIGNYWYMFHPTSGAMITGFYRHTWATNPQGGPKTCYYDGNGHMLYGSQFINGRWYIFSSGSGAMQ